MKLEIILSVMNLQKDNLDKMNITSKCTVINQCGKEEFEKYKNFNIYSYNENGLSKSRNRGLEHISEDIILLCDDDMVYNKDYEKLILEEFQNNSKADIIVFNINSPNRKIKINNKNKKINIFNGLRYTSCRIAFKRESIEKCHIKFNQLFGAGEKYSHGEDTLFIVDALKNGLSVFTSTKNIGTVHHTKSTWFTEYNKDFFFNKGALFTAIDSKFRHILCLQYLLRHKDVLKKVNLIQAYKYMLQGSMEYINDKKISKEG